MLQRVVCEVSTDFEIGEANTIVARSSPELTNPVESLSPAGRAARSYTGHDFAVRHDIAP